MKSPENSTPWSPFCRIPHLIRRRPLFFSSLAESSPLRCLSLLPGQNEMRELDVFLPHLFQGQVLNDGKR